MESFRDDFLAKLKDLVYDMGLPPQSASQRMTIDSWQENKGENEKQIQDLYLSLHHVRFLATLLGKQCRWYHQLQAFPDRFCLSAFARDEIKLMKREWKEMTDLFRQQQRLLQTIDNQFRFQDLIDLLYEKQDQVDRKRSEGSLSYQKEQALNRLCHQHVAAQRNALHQYKRIQQENLESIANKIDKTFHQAFEQLNESLIQCLKQERDMLQRLETQSDRLGANLQKAWNQLKGEMAEKIQGLRSAYDLIQVSIGFLPHQGPSMSDWSRHQAEVEQILLKIERDIRSTVKDLPLAPAHVCKDPARRVALGNQVQQIFQQVLALQSRWQRDQIYYARRGRNPCCTGRTRRQRRENKAPLCHHGHRDGHRGRQDRATIRSLHPSRRLTARTAHPARDPGRYAEAHLRSRDGQEHQPGHRH